MRKPFRESSSRTPTNFFDTMGNLIVKDVPVPVAEPVKVPSGKPSQVPVKKPTRSLEGASTTTTYIQFPNGEGMFVRPMFEGTKFSSELTLVSQFRDTSGEYTRTLESMMETCNYKGKVKVSGDFREVYLYISEDEFVAIGMRAEIQRFIRNMTGQSLVDIMLKR